MTPPTLVRISADLASHVMLGVLTFDGMQVVDDGSGSTPEPPPDNSDIAERTAMVRAMYRRMGIDPTKTRPSSEALWRRVRRGQPWPRINSLVDACNACSLVTQLPFGLYDLDRIVGDVMLRLGRDGEEYQGIRKSIVHLTGRPTLVDATGPFGNPTSDSARTMVTATTQRALMTVYAPTALKRTALTDVLAMSAARVTGTTNGITTRSVIVVGDDASPTENTRPTTHDPRPTTHDRRPTTHD